MWAIVTIPCPGRDRESRTSVISVSVYRVSPAKSGCGKLTSPSPSCATRVPWVNWPTEAPTIVARVHIEFMRRWPNGCVAEKAASRCSACVFMVSEEKSTLSASVAVRPGRWRYTAPTSNSST